MFHLVVQLLTKEANGILQGCSIPRFGYLFLKKILDIVYAVKKSNEV